MSRHSDDALPAAVADMGRTRSDCTRGLIVTKLIQSEQLSTTEQTRGSARNETRSILFPQSNPWRGAKGKFTMRNSGKAMDGRSEIRAAERREHRRMDLQFPVELRELQKTCNPIRTRTSNVSTGGVYVELDDCQWVIGDRIRIDMTVPPAEGVSSETGRASCDAVVVRREQLPSKNDNRLGIGLRFEDRLKLTF